MKLTAAQLIRQVAAIVREIAESVSIDALLIRAGVFRHQVTRAYVFHAYRHVILVGAVAAIVDPVAQLILGDALVIRALESSVCVALEVCCTEGRRHYLLFLKN